MKSSYQYHRCNRIDGWCGDSGYVIINPENRLRITAVVPIHLSNRPKIRRYRRQSGKTEVRKTDDIEIQWDHRLWMWLGYKASRKTNKLSGQVKVSTKIKSKINSLHIATHKWKRVRVSMLSRYKNKSHKESRALKTIDTKLHEAVFNWKHTKTDVIKNKSHYRSYYTRNGSRELQKSNGHFQPECGNNQKERNYAIGWTALNMQVYQ